MKGNFNAIIGSKKPVFINFYAHWHQSCKVRIPVLRETTSSIQGKGLMLIKTRRLPGE